MAELPPRKRVDDAELLRALAHPLRMALLQYLTAIGPRTASECADAVGSTASNCSWHLRQLAQHGLVERSESGDGRERPWRARQVGLDFGEFGDDPVLTGAQLAVTGTQLNQEQELTQRYLDSFDHIEPEWRDAGGMTNYTLRVTPAELDRLVNAIDALVRPYAGPIRADTPADALPVHLGVRAFLRLEHDGKPSA
ncbi:helix-turn-helix domain-containing protein [Amycolatopsis sp. PS_44_ISF1]|uniref:winged helix-turn-helix domain-containing protein n=1 Tax=Amycolatopsis sp. PS_44_ISF1 TaxID=2974917 RepID=UPI0028DF2F7D|nr:helix-turn-helix domain-containing protein [Amycolatopsis sp. PS_44_ISF1]MDT8912676.1 helix-turn-helix domain-containing protein [Amycolatopsis sp. PS_44_ISF1]